MLILVTLVALFGSTFAVIVMDRAVRSARSAYALPSDEPAYGTLVVLAVLCNVIVLPYYFYKTRHSAVAALIGGAATLCCFGFTVGVRILVSVIAGAH